MQQLKLSVRPRESGKPGQKELQDNDVRGVVYGHGVDPIPVSASYRELSNLFTDASYNHVVELDFADQDNRNVLFKDVQYDPVTNHINHFDFYVFKKGEKIQAEVPITFVGDAPAVIKGAQMITFLEQVEVSAIPSKLPDHYELDITGLEEIGDSLHVSDLKDFEDVEILADAEQVVAKIEEIQELQVEDDSPEEVEEGEEGDEGDEAVEGEEGGDSEGDTEESGAESAPKSKE